MLFFGRRILVVEDEFLVSLVTTDLLESEGCVIVGPASRVAAALEFAQSELIDAAVLDIDVRGQMIWPVAEELQRRAVPFLFLSAYAHRDVIPARFGAALCLDKPMQNDRLLAGLSAMW